MQYRCENITFGKILAIIKITLNLFIKINRLLGEETSLPRLMSRVRIPSPAPIQSLVFTRLFPYLYHFLPCIKRHEKAQKNTEKHINTYINTAIIGQKLGSKKESCKSSLVPVDSAVYLTLFNSSAMNSALKATYLCIISCFFQPPRRIKVISFIPYITHQEAQ